jgi:hypothetical protein
MKRTSGKFTFMIESNPFFSKRLIFFFCSNTHKPAGQNVLKANSTGLNSPRGQTSAAVNVNASVSADSNTKV